MTRYRRLAWIAATAVAASVVFSAGSTAGAALPTCVLGSTLVPEVGEVMMTQGLKTYERLTRGKDLSVKLYLRLPTTCTVANNQSITITGASLTAQESIASTPLSGSPFAPAATPTGTIGSSILPNSSADPVFFIPGSSLLPSNATVNIAPFNVTFTGAVNYTAKAGTATSVGSLSVVSQPGSANPITAAVEQRTNAIRMLLVPFGDGMQPFDTQWPSAAGTTADEGMSTLSRILPVPAGASSSVVADTGGIRYTQNPALLNLKAYPGLYNGNGKFCGTSGNFETFRPELSNFHTQFNALNPTFYTHVVVGGAWRDISDGSAAGCAEGMASATAPQTWVRVVPGSGTTTPSQMGALLGQEVTHTFGLSATASFHSANTAADASAPDRAWSLVGPRWIQDDRSVMRLTSGWNNTNTLLEPAEWEALQCALGGSVASACATPPTGTNVNVAAGPTLSMIGRSDGTAGGTLIRESFVTTSAPLTPKHIGGPWVVRQTYTADGATQTDDYPIPVSAAVTGGDADHGTASAQALIHANIPAANGIVTKIELLKDGNVVYTAEGGAAPSVVTTTTTAAGQARNYTQNVDADDRDPALSPDGTLIAWSCGENSASLSVCSSEGGKIGPVGRDIAAATALGDAIEADGEALGSGHFDAVPPLSNPNAISDAPLSSFPTEGKTFAILTSGDATLANTPNSSGNSGASAGGGSIGRGGTERDVTVVKWAFTVPDNENCLTFDFQFYSEEFPEYVGTRYNDAFIAELDGSTWTTTDTTGGDNVQAPGNFAFDANGKPVTINSAGVGMSPENALGTTYDGATSLLQASTSVTPGEHVLYLSIFDQGDQVLDSAVFVDNFRTYQAAGGECTQGAKIKGRTLRVGRVDNPTVATTVTSLDGDNVEPAWSHDGGRLAWVNSGDVYTATADLSGRVPTFGPARRVYDADDLAGRDPASSPSWTQDGNHLVIAAGGDIVKISASGTGDPVNLTNTAEIVESSPSAAPTGTDRVVYTVGPDVHVLDLASPGSRQLLIANASDPWFGHDQIAFVRNGVWTARADGTGLVQRTTVTADVRPSLSRNLLAFDRSQSPRDVFLMNLTQPTLTARVSDGDTPPEKLRGTFYFDSVGELNFPYAVGLEPDRIEGGDAIWEIAFDTSLMPAGAEAKFWANDGVNVSNRNLAHGFAGTTVANKPPHAGIFNPLQGETYPPYATIDIRGWGYDPEQGPLAGEWTVDGAAAGAGEAIRIGPLGQGEHKIRLVVRDAQGLEATAERTFHVVGDAAPPLITLSLNAANAPAPASGWFKNAPVKVDLTVQDPSGIGSVSCTVDRQPVALPTLSFGALSYTATLSVNGDDRHEVACTASDAASTFIGTSGTTTEEIQLDTTAPTVAVTGVADAATYTVGAVPTAGCTATDALSGLSGTPILTVTGGTVNGVGSFTATCTASDVAGNTATATATYAVKYANASGFLPPIKSDNTSVFNRGKSIPYKITIDGGPATGYVTTGWTIRRVQVNCATGFNETGATETEVASNTPSQVFRADTSVTPTQYIYNADQRTDPVGTCWKAILTLDDGQVKSSGVYKLTGK